MDFDEIFRIYQKYNEEEFIKFWKLSVELIPLPTFKGKITLLIF